MDLKDIDRKYGIVIEASHTYRVVEVDDETMEESEWDEIEIEFSYKKKRSRKIVRDVLPLSHFIPIYRSAKRFIRKSKQYTHTYVSEDVAYKSDFDVLKYIEELIKREEEQTGPMFG